MTRIIHQSEVIDHEIYQNTPHGSGSDGSRWNLAGGYVSQVAWWVGDRGFGLPDLSGRSGT